MSVPGIDRQVDKPQPGFFRLRLVRNGPFVACWITRLCQCTINGPGRHAWVDSCDRYPPLTCIVDGYENESMTNQVWHHGEAIDSDVYNLMLDKATWDRQHAPESPGANPEKPVDLDDLPSVF